MKKEHFFIGLILIGLCLNLGCKQNANPNTKAPANDDPNEITTIINNNDDPNTTVTTQDGGSLIFVKEEQETVDSITYSVKSYALVYGSPYIYKYYKYYYLDSKIRSIHVYNHCEGCALDYKYTEFVEHICVNRGVKLEDELYYKSIFKYNALGLLESEEKYDIQYNEETSSLESYRYAYFEYTYYNDENHSLKSNCYTSEDWHINKYFFSNGTKAIDTTDYSGTFYSSCYYPSGFLHYRIRGDDGTWNSSTDKFETYYLYTYEDNETKEPIGNTSLATSITEQELQNLFNELISQLE